MSYLEGVGEVGVTAGGVSHKSTDDLRPPTMSSQAGLLEGLSGVLGLCDLFSSAAVEFPNILANCETRFPVERRERVGDETCSS